MNGAPLNFSARTYLSTIANAMTIREENGALTRFKHVKSHTGNRDKASIGNEAADRKAKQAALEEKTDTTDDITHFEHELSYVVFTEDHNTHPNTKKWTPIHGNIRQELKNHHKKTLIEQWANTKDRPKAAELINKAKNKILELIDEIWKEPTTLKIQFLLHVLNQADRTWPRPICERCMKNIPETPRHILECPANADIFNQASKKIGKILEIYDPEDEMDIAFHTEENSPFGGTYDAVEKLTRKILEPHRLHSTRRTEFEISEGRKVTIPGQMASLILRLFEQKERGEETQSNRKRKLSHTSQEPARGKWDHIPYTEILPNINLERTYKIEIGDTLLIPGEYSEQQGEGKTNMWLAKTLKVDQEHVEVAWFTKIGDEEPVDSWWKLTEQTLTITDPYAILSKVHWNNTRHEEGIELNTLEKKEWNRLHTVFQEAQKKKSWEGQAKKKIETYQ